MIHTHINRCLSFNIITSKQHCVKSVRVRSISLYSVRMRENTDQSNTEYGHFSRSAGSGMIVMKDFKDTGKNEN